MADAGILSEMNMILMPSSIGIIDILTVTSALHNIGCTTTEAVPPNERKTSAPDSNTYISSPDDSSGLHASLEPETTRHDRDDFEFDIASQLDYPNTQNSFQRFSPMSPISPIKSNTHLSQSPLMTPLSVVGVGKNHVQKSPILNKSSLHQQMKHLDLNSSEKADRLKSQPNLVFDNVDFVAEANIMSISYDNDGNNVSYSDDLSSLKSSSPPVLTDLQNQSDVNELVDNDSFLNSSNISICFSDKCTIAEKNKSTFKEKQQYTMKSKNSVKHSAQLTTQWNLPLQVKKDGCKSVGKQQTLCSTHCTSHSEHSNHTEDPTHDQQDQGESEEENKNCPGNKVDFISMELNDRLDNFNAEMVSQELGFAYSQFSKL